MVLQCAQRARKHKVGRGRVRDVIASPLVVALVRSAPQRYVFLGDDRTGRALEVVAVVDGGDLIVIHAMDLRPKYRNLYEEGKLT